MRAVRVGVLRHTVFKLSERFIPDQVRAIPDAVPTIIARDPVQEPVNGLRAVRMPIRGRLDAARYVLLGWDAPLRDALQAESSELLHAHFGVEGMYSRRAARALDIPHVVTLHGFDVSYSARGLLAARTASWARYAALRGQLLASDSLFICVSEHVRRLAIGLGAKEERTRVLATGVDTEAFQVTPVPEQPRIVHVARLVEKKGTAYLVEAVRRVRDVVPDVRLDIVGDGPLRPALESRIAASGLEGTVRLLGAKAHVETLAAIRAAAVVAVPSVTARSGDTEGLPQVVLEAGALGRPVVASIHAGVPEAVTNTVTGLLVPERDTRGLAEALISLLTDHSAAQRMGTAGREQVQREFDLRRQARLLRQMYSEELA